MNTFSSLAESLHFLDNGVAGLGGNPTVVLFVSGHHYVALHTPVSSPAARHNDINHIGQHEPVKKNKLLPVLDKPVVLVSLSSIAYSQHSMIELRL